MPQLDLLLFVGFALASIVLASRLSVRRWARWAQRAADYGTTDILNAKYIDSDEAVMALRSRFDAWSMLVRDSTARFCQEDDAFRLQCFDTSASADATGFNDEHRYIRQATAERVRRLLDLAARLQDGRTRLRHYWVPRVSD
jgi:hypothetical protein